MLERQNEVIQRQLDAKKKKRKATISVKDVGQHCFSTLEILAKAIAIEKERAAKKKGKRKQTAGEDEEEEDDDDEEEEDDDDEEEEAGDGIELEELEETLYIDATTGLRTNARLGSPVEDEQ
ncbi:uncharacterized protein I303_102693 [Kwoniella dejecticola CBS 10117]|uniref:Uncharacterized protein n=1 Tax=Kwoniella dejecticola CBS 10117 TaxID=1296121 RepID=A0AAJ8KKH7_9TREE